MQIKKTPLEQYFPKKEFHSEVFSLTIKINITYEKG